MHKSGTKFSSLSFFKLTVPTKRRKEVAIKHRVTITSRRPGIPFFLLYINKDKQGRGGPKWKVDISKGQSRTSVSGQDESGGIYIFHHLPFGYGGPSAQSDWRLPKTNPTACWFRSNQIDHLSKQTFLKHQLPLKRAGRLHLENHGHFFFLFLWMAVQACIILSIFKQEEEKEKKKIFAWVLKSQLCILWDILLLKCLLLLFQYTQNYRELINCILFLKRQIKKLKWNWLK